MLSTESTGGAFTLGRCTSCAGPSLTYLDSDESGSLIHRCLRCDATITAELVAVPTDQLEQHGYAVVGEGGGGGCGSGGCGSGGCGVRPPA